MKIHEPELTSHEFVKWALGERGKRTKSEKTRIDTEIAALHRQGKINTKLFEKYKTAINLAA